MKKYLLLLFAPFLLIACRKNTEINGGPVDVVRDILQNQLSAKDLGAVDFSSVVQTKLSNGHTLYRVAMGKENIVLDVAADGSFVKGNIYQVTGSVAKVNGHSRYSGLFNRSSLQRTDAVSYSIENGFIKELHSYTAVVTNGLQQKVNYACADCTLPEVIVSSSYSSGGGISWASWMSLLAMFDMGSQNDYLAIDWGSGGGGGGGGSYTPPPAITIDTEASENKEKIDTKKYLDCFGNIPNDGATCTITISTDIPVDGHPEILFDWSEGNPGHAFIELYKAGSNGGIVSQNIGFYPSIGFTVLGGTNVPSKVVDNAYHEYNARYTISVSPAQLQAAIDKANAISGNSYNMTDFNCVDFALAIFNAGTGGALSSIPKRQIPGYNTPNGSSTPQGLYDELNNMGGWGVPGVQTVGSKAYGGSSKGPCN